MTLTFATNDFYHAQNISEIVLCDYNKKNDQ